MPNGSATSSLTVHRITLSTTHTIMLCTCAQAALRAERADASRSAQEAAELRRQVELMGDELRVLRVEGRADKVGWSTRHRA